MLPGTLELLPSPLPNGSFRNDGASLRYSTVTVTSSPAFLKRCTCQCDKRQLLYHHKATSTKIEINPYTSRLSPENSVSVITFETLKALRALPAVTKGWRCVPRYRTPAPQLHTCSHVSRGLRPGSLHTLPTPSRKLKSCEKPAWSANGQISDAGDTRQLVNWTLQTENLSFEV